VVVLGLEVVVLASGVVVVVELGVVVVLVSGVVVVVELGVVVVLASGVVVVVELGVVVVLDCAFTWVAADSERTAAVTKAGMMFLFMSRFYQIGRRHTIRSNPTRFFRPRYRSKAGTQPLYFVIGRIER